MLLYVMCIINLKIFGSPSLLNGFHCGCLYKACS